jgi:CTP synthase
MHPWFVATQAHPEFKSRPNRPAPLYREFIGAALTHEGRIDDRAVAEAATWTQA